MVRLRIGVQHSVALVAIVTVVAVALQSARAGSLASIAPSGVSAGQTIAITGTGFDPAAANNTVTFTSAAGDAVNATATGVATLDATAGIRRLTVAVPATLPVGTATVRVTSRTTGEATDARALEIVSLSLPEATSVARGTTGLVVPIAGSANSRFAAGARVTFGAGITVRATVVDSPTQLHVTIDVTASDTLGSRDVAVMSPTQLAVLTGGFAVVAAPTNTAPVVTANVDGALTLPAIASVRGTVADDGLPAGTVTTTWSKVSGPGDVTFANAASATTTASFGQAGTYVLRLTASDSTLTGFSDATIVVSRGDATITVTGFSGPFDGNPHGATGTATGALGEDLSSLLHLGSTFVDAPGGIAQWTFDGSAVYKPVTGEAAITIVAAPATGRGIITGRVFNDGDGLPLGGARADLIAAGDGAPLPPTTQATTDSLGRFRLSSAAGRARVRLSKDGFTTVERVVDVLDGKRVDPVDARLTVLDVKAVTVTSVLGNVASNSAGDVRVTIGPGALSADASVRLTRVNSSGLAGLLPLGWSPVVAFDVEPAAVSFSTPAALAVTAPSRLARGAASVVVRWDTTVSAWTVVQQATRSADGTSLQASLHETGQYAFVLADAAPMPPAAVPGQPLPGGAAVVPTDATVAIAPSPRILFANTGAHSLVQVAVASTPPLPSGSALQLDMSESYMLADGAALALPRTPRRLPLYQFSPLDGSASAMAAESRVVATPSRSIAQSRLQRGAIDLAARLPAAVSAAYGTLITTAGGQFADSFGDRIAIDPGSSNDDLPVALTRLEPTEIPVSVPAGLTLAGAIDFDLHGAALLSPARLSIPVPPGFLSTTPVLVARVTEADDATHLELVAIAQPQGSSLATSIDPFGDGSVRLPGVRAEGCYVFVQPAVPIGFASGVVTAADGSPLAGALVTGGTLGLVALTGADGRYTIASTAGDTTFTTTDASTGDHVAFAAHIDPAAIASTSTSVGPTPFAIAAVTPADGAASVAIAATIRASFSSPVDPLTVAGGVTLTTNGTPIAGSVTLTPDGLSLVFRPGTLLQSNTPYEIAIGAGLKGTSGRPLAAPAIARFTTIDLTPPAPPAAGAVTATIPDSTGFSTISGSQGTAPVDGSVIVRNLRTGADTVFTPRADGSFSGVVASLKSDRLQLTIRDAAGNTTAVPLDPFRNADGSVVVGSQGGHVEGPGGTFIDIPPGALDDGTVVRVEPVALDALPLAPPAQFPFVGGLRLDIGDAVSRTSLHVGVQAPPDATADEQVLVGAPLQLKNRTTWTLVDRAHLVNGRFMTESWPFPSVVSSGIFGYFRPAAAGERCISYVNVLVDYGAPVVIEALSDPFAFVADVQSLVLAKRCESSLDIQVRDPDTDAVIQQLNARTPAQNGEIDALGDTVTDDHTAPLVTDINTFNGQQVDHIEIRFSEPMDDSLKDPQRDVFHVEDAHGNRVAGVVELTAANTFATFRPAVPFKAGQQYLLRLDGASDRAGNALHADVIAFTPFDPAATSPFPIKKLVDVPGLSDALTKCANGSCNTSVRDNATIGNYQFLANGLANATEAHQVFPPQRLVVVDQTDVTSPVRIGFGDLGFNPRVLAAVDKIGQITFPNNGAPLRSHDDLLLVASGGRVAGNVDLPSRLEIFDVAPCTTGNVRPNCLGAGLSLRKGLKYLSTPPESAPKRGVPLEAGVPQQMAVLHQQGVNGADDTIAAYVVVSGVGLEAVDVAHALNQDQLDDPATSDLAPIGPDGFVRGDYLDVAIVKNQVAAVAIDETTGASRLDLFSAQLTNKRPVALAGPAARLAILENVPVAAADGTIDSDEELFDVALVASGQLTTCPPNTPSPCGELAVVDLSALTLNHASDRGVITRIPLPGPAFGIRVDSTAGLAYVELRGVGLAVIDLNNITRAIARILQDGVSSEGLQDANRDGVDDRVLSVIAKPDIFNGRISMDTTRGLAFINGSITGPITIEVANRCIELSADFGPDDEDSTSRAARTGRENDEADLVKEKATLSDVLQRAAGRLLDSQIGPVAMLEQGSGACFWRQAFPESCTSFQAGVSDHDVEVFVPQAQVNAAQAALDAFLDDESKRPDSPLNGIGRVTLFAVSKEAFEAAELLNGTPRNRTGDPAGDLAMGRQLLLLLWILEGEYVEGLEGPVALEEILDRFKSFDSGTHSIVPGEPSGIPRLEGYEWSLLQELNFYKTGAMLRIPGGCGSANLMLDASAKPDEVNDRGANFGAASFLSQDCADQLHTVAKSGIRTVMARLAANDLANPLLLDITRDEYANDGCYTGVLDPRSPPSDPLGYTKKPCGSFEEYIASVAVNSVKLGFGVFNAEDLPQIFTLYCAKVGAHCADRDGNKIGRPLFANDLEANQFIVDTIAFIERAKDLTRPAYDDSIGHDGKPVGEIPFLAEIAAACADHGVAGLDADSPRSLIRACNRAIVDRKLNGDPDLQIPPPLPAELVTQARALELQKKLGAKNLVLKDLRVRVSNESAHDVAETVVRMYIGDGVRTSTYDVKTQVPLVGLAAGTTRVLERDGDGHPLFPMAFVLPNLAPDVRSAIAFFVDPERRVPEANKRDNQASFFYYELNRLNPAGPDPHLPETPEPPIQDVSSDPLCRAEPAFTLTLGIRRVEDTAALATNQLTVTMGQPVRLEYRVQSRATTTLKQLTIHRTGASDRVFAPVDLPPASQNPAGYHNVEEFSPDAAGTFVIVATGAAQDARGNTIRAESPRVSLTVTRAPCDVAITTLKPDPNPFDRNTGLPVSEIMEGGSLFRHYRVLNGRTGQPLPGTELRVRGRELPGGAFFDLPPGTTDDDGYIVHEPTSLFDDSLRGLKLDVATLDAGAPAHPNQRFEIRLEPQQSDVDNSCGQTFEVAVKDREFTRTFATGTSLKIATRRLFGPFGIAGNVGIGIDLSQTASPAPTQPGAPPPVPKPLTLGRSLNLTSQLQTGAQLKSLKNALFGKDSKVELSGQGSLGVVLMGQDKHEFETPLSLGSCIDMAYLVESTLMVGAAAAVPVPVPGLTLVMLALDEITQRVSGISDRRTSFGAAAGVAVGGGLDLKFPAVRFQNSGVSFFDDKGASGVDLAVSVGGALSETAGLSYSSTIAPAASEQLVTGTITTKIAGQFGLNFAAGAAEAKEDTGEAADNVDEHAFAAVADELTRGLQASGSGSMTFAATWDASQIPPPMKQIAFSISAEVGWGITQEILDGTAGGSGSSGSTRKWSFTVSEPLKFPSALESIVVIHALIAGQAAGGATGSVLLGPTALQKQFMKLIALADSFSSEIEYGAGHEFELGVSKLTGSKNLPNIGLSFKYDESVSHETESGSIRRGGKFRLASYADQDALVPSPDGTALADTINSCLDAVQPGTSAALARTIATIATGVGAAKSIVDVILTPGAPTPPFDAHAQAGGPLEATPAYQSPAPSTGASLLVDGASEPDPDQPLEIEALAFEYRAQQETPDVPIQRPFDVRGRLDRPHYGIGGFFQFAPDARPLAAPATLTIRYSDAEISAADESALGIFVWDDNARDWAFLGGTVDTAANTITVDVTRLGMYAAGLPMPSGTVSFTAQSLSGAADPNPTTNVTYTSGVIRMNTGAVVPDGTLFTVHVVAENAADLSPFGSIQSADEDPASDGVQVSAHGGVVQFSAELPGKSGSARVFVSSVVGTALADQVVTYQ